MQREIPFGTSKCIYHLVYSIKVAAGVVFSPNLLFWGASLKGIRMNLSTRTKGKHAKATTNDFVKQKQKENSQKQQKHLILQIHTNSINIH